MIAADEASDTATPEGARTRRDHLQSCQLVAITYDSLLDSPGLNLKCGFDAIWSDEAQRQHLLSSLFVLATLKADGLIVEPGDRTHPPSLQSQELKHDGEAGRQACAFDQGAHRLVQDRRGDSKLI